MESKARNGDTPTSPAFGKLKQEDHYKFEASLYYKTLSQKIEKRSKYYVAKWEKLRL